MNTLLIIAGSYTSLLTLFLCCGRMAGLGDRVEIYDDALEA